MRKIIAVDFDGTLCDSNYPELGEPIRYIIDYIKEQQEQGALIILLTMRENELLCEAVEWCEQQGLKFDAVNDNLPHMKEFFRNNPRKIFANEYIDDHAISFRDIPRGCGRPADGPLICPNCGVLDHYCKTIADKYCPECGQKFNRVT